MQVEDQVVLNGGLVSLEAISRAGPQSGGPAACRQQRMTAELM